MKKSNYLFMLLFVACVFCSCKWGAYIPSTLNLGGTSTQVVLSKANFRVVRNIEAVIEVNNKNLRRADVEKSAFAELTRKYPLSGSQAYINVVCEEIRRENNNLFRYWFGGQPNRKQFIAVRATIIEFLQENGEPVKSPDFSYDTTSQRVVQEGTDALSAEDVTPKKSEKKKDANVTETKRYTIANDYYLAYLMRTDRYNKKEDQLLNDLCDIKRALYFSQKYETSALEEYGKKHDKRLEKYAKK